MLEGVININKDKGMTSNDVVVRLRRILSQKRIGHTGTLDPLATGVLPVCIGRATQISDYIMGTDKTYRARLLLGTTTDTDDCTGSVLSHTDCDITTDELKSAVACFTGEIKQIPPMYSAIKQNGVPLYKLARKGEVVDRKERTITVFSADIVEKTAKNTFDLIFVCSKGTYIRTLCADIGARLGVGGCLQELTRLSNGNYTLHNAFTLQQVEQMVSNGDFSFIQQPETALTSLPCVHMQHNTVLRFLNGLDINGERIQCDNPLAVDGVYRVYLDDIFAALGRYNGETMHMVCLLCNPELVKVSK